MKNTLITILTMLLFNCNGTAQKNNSDEVFSITKTDDEWKAQLNELQYYILRKAGTERAFSSDLDKNYSSGIYICAACETPLFKSDHKFDSGSGWPSFDRAISNNVSYSVDYNVGYARTEEHCSTCGGHLGHVFDDGPKKTTGKRHCINGAALTFVSIKK
ncbi:peptide-methionine (R)-S-oxide reductase MsrB [Flavobacteriaceae bacterium]|mgnify:FL=1|jgi:peptide-methionine (R)-S-oxide reductase|nr:peptide-methionine (R)-S-oxide reductase MsrB [Flavobacteriaceae bacterium]